LYKRKCELESARDDWQQAKEDALEALTDEGIDPENPPEDPTEGQQELLDAWEAAQQEPDDFGPDEKEELAELESLENEISGFMHGVQLIPENDFEAYAREFAEETGAVEQNASWPMNCIDWREAAEELQSDYSVISYQGEDYYFRD
jgi:hypothetical protein